MPKKPKKPKPPATPAKARPSDEADWDGDLPPEELEPSTELPLSAAEENEALADDGIAFVQMLEEAEAQGDFDVIEANLEPLERLIEEYQDRIDVLLRLRDRAESVMLRFRPPMRPR